MPQKLDKLPDHMIATEQGAKYGEYYALILDLKVGSALSFTCDDFGEDTQDIEQLVNRLHSITQTLHVRKGQNKRFSCRRDTENQCVYVVRKANVRKEG